MGWEVTVGRAESGDEMIFEGLYGPFRRIDPVFVGWDELPFDVVAA